VVVVEVAIFAKLSATKTQNRCERPKIHRAWKPWLFVLQRKGGVRLCRAHPPAETAAAPWHCSQPN
jgi:hypothetical protein